MEFDRFAVALLVLRPDAPRLDERAEDALQDAHLAFLANLHHTGALLAAGPLLGSDDRQFRGLSIFGVDPEQALALAQEDPGVRAGRYAIQVFPWMVPNGAMSFSPTRFPRSMAEASARNDDVED
jgi:uncharacterized protein YciI